MWNRLKAISWAIEQWVRFGSTFHRTRFVTAEAFWHRLAGNDLQQFIQESPLFFTGTGLGNCGGELAYGVHLTLKAQPPHAYVVSQGGLRHQAANEVVSNEEHFQFFMDHLG